MHIDDTTETGAHPFPPSNRRTPNGRFIDAYRQLFTSRGTCGEFTPAYLQLPWIAGPMREACDDLTPLIVLVRDPVEWFSSVSAARWYETLRWRAGLDIDRATLRLRWSTLVWAGMYSDRLESWAKVFDRDRPIVIQHEAATLDPTAACRRVFSALGLDAFTPAEPGRSPTTTDPPGPRSSWMEDALRTTYEPTIDPMSEHWASTALRGPILLNGSLDPADLTYEKGKGQTIGLSIAAQPRNTIPR